MKFKKLVTTILAVSLAVGVFSACGVKKDDIVDEAEKAKDEVVAEVEKAKDEVVDKAEEVKDEVVAEVEDATKTEGTEVELTAAILERKAILPGSSFKVHYTVTNNSDKAIGYVHGSGSAVVPDALIIVAPELQAVPAKENLGAMTMDMQTKVLEAGESIEFVQSFIAIKPTEDFIQKAMDFMQESGEYVGELNLDAFADKIEGLEAVEAGQYVVNGEFVYETLENTEDLSVVSNATGLASVTTDVSIG